MISFMATYYPIITHPFILVIFISLCGALAIFLVDQLIYRDKSWHKILRRKDE
jgi:hypothetical protein